MKLTPSLNQINIDEEFVLSILRRRINIFDDYGNRIGRILFKI